MEHVAVLQKEVLEYLDPKTNQNFIDCTVGFAGHASAILENNGPAGKVLGIEQDPQIYQKLEVLKNERFKERLILINDSYTNLEKIIKEHNFGPIAGILFDLGLSSWHLEESGRGFSFQKDELLDMRFNPKFGLTAQEIVGQWPESEIVKILEEYGEERFAKRIAREICEARKLKSIKTTLQLVEIIRRAFPKKYKFGKTHLATKTFQALRIAVNNELENLRIALPKAIEVLRPEGRLVVISFHSLEDRIVKNFFKEEAKNGRLEILTKKPIQSSKEELKLNPRSRSAKLRATRKIS